MPPAVPPPLPSQRTPGPQPPGEFGKPAELQSSRLMGNLPTGNVFNRWIGTNSTNVNRIRCEPYTDKDGNQTGLGDIYVEFLSLALYKYPGRPLNDFLDLFTSSSKGRYTYYEVRGSGPSVEGKSIWPFVKLRGPQRTPAEVRRLAAKREPLGGLPALRYYNVGGRYQAGGAGGRSGGRPRGQTIKPRLPSI